jgi:hypothetical protein
MCFSAPASFVAGGVLSVAGVTTIRKASRKAEIPFAAIPLFFGIQQIIEGLIWLSLTNESLIGNSTLTVLYSLFSHVFWPIFVPFAVRLLETNPRRRKLLLGLQAVGVFVGLYLLYFIIQFPIASRVLGKHIVYDSPHFYIQTIMALYLVATCASSMVSSNRVIQIFGVLSLATFLAAYAIHAATLISVWCFFAAVLSLVVYYYFRTTHARQVS